MEHKSVRFVTPDMAYEAHREIAGGVSGVNTSVKLPERLTDTPPRVQRNWYGQACWQTLHMQGKGTLAKIEDTQDVPIPGCVTAEDARETRIKAHELYWRGLGFYG